MVRHLELSTEFYKVVSAGSILYNVHLAGDEVDMHGIVINILSEDAFHLDIEFKERLDHIGIEPDKIKSALEQGQRKIGFEKNNKKENV